MNLNEEEFEVLMVKVIDDTATELERAALMSFLAQHPDKRREYEDHLGISAGFKNIRLRLSHDDQLNKIEKNPLRRFEEKLGASLFIGGFSFLLSMAFFEILVDAAMPTWLKIGVAIIFAGTSLLLFSAWRSRKLAAASDPYREVHR